MKTLARYLGYATAIGASFLIGEGLSFGQQNGFNPAPVFAFGAIMTVVMVFCLAYYIYTALALQTIANKTNTETAGLSGSPLPTRL